VNIASTKPLVSTWATPPAPTRVYPASFSSHAIVEVTAAWWAASIFSETSFGATAHSVEIDLTGEKVASNPATAEDSGRDTRAKNPDRS